MNKFYKNEDKNNLFIRFSASDSPETVGILTELKANTSDGAQEKHVPVVSVSGSNVEVCVGSVAHPMLEEHYITGIYLETSRGGHFASLKPGAEPKASFVLSEGEQLIAVYEYCNLHGLWKVEL